MGYLNYRIDLKYHPWIQHTRSQQELSFPPAAEMKNISNCILGPALSPIVNKWCIPTIGSTLFMENRVLNRTKRKLNTSFISHISILTSLTIIILRQFSCITHIIFRNQQKKKINTKMWEVNYNQKNEVYLAYIKHAILW